MTWLDYAIAIPMILMLWAVAFMVIVGLVMTIADFINDKRGEK